MDSQINYSKDNLNIYFVLPTGCKSEDDCKADMSEAYYVNFDYYYFKLKHFCLFMIQINLEMFGGRTQPRVGNGEESCKNESN